MEPEKPPQSVPKPWAFLVLALAGPALVIEIVLAAKTDATTPLLRRFSGIGLPLSLVCLAVLMLVRRKHPLLRWLWITCGLSWGFWVVGFVARILGRS